jgi:outer membrane protein assembly factor BamC
MKQQLILKSISVMLLLGALSACDSIPFIDNSSDYKGAGRSRPLEVPPDLTAAKTSDAYSIPGSTSYSSYNENQEGQEPGVEQILPTADGVKMEKAGAQRWLVVNAPAEKIWPVIREFWLDQGFAVRVESPETGVMETEWVEADAIKLKEDKRNMGDKFDAWLDKLSGLADKRKFRTRLERGEKAGTTEIYMTHRSVNGAPDDGKNVVNTQLGKIETGYRLDADKKTNTADQYDSDLDVELLRRLMVKLGVAEKQAQEIAANPVSPKRASVAKESDGSVTLTVDDAFDRAWRRVGLALDRIGFVMEDKNRSEGVFYVRYSDVDIDDAPKKKKGLFETLKFWGDDDEDKNKSDSEKEKSFTDKLKFWKGTDDKTDSSKQYRIKVTESNQDSSSVNVVDKDGKRDTTTTANRIISLLYEQLK